MRRTKIICTIGPATSSEKKLNEMYKAGMNAVRLNMTHGTHESHLKIIKLVNKMNKTVKYPGTDYIGHTGPGSQNRYAGRRFTVKKGRYNNNFGKSRGSGRELYSY